MPRRVAAHGLTTSPPRRRLARLRSRCLCAQVTGIGASLRTMTKQITIAFILAALPLWACEKKAQTVQPTAAAPSSPPAAARAVGDDPAGPRLAVGTAAKCPVTGEDFTVSAGTVQVTYSGKRYAFCCAECQPTFAKNPTKYAKN